MGFLDRIKDVLTGAPAEAADPKGPLGLLPGDEVRYYQDAFLVTGTRVVFGTEGVRYQYVLRSERGARLVLVVRDAQADSWSLERPVPNEGLPWTAADWTDRDGQSYRLAGETRDRVRSYGDTGVSGAKHVHTRRFADEDDDGTLILEDWGGHREARVGEPVYDGQLSFSGGAGNLESRPWADGDAEEDDDLVDATDDSEMSKGTPLAAALALEGRLALDRPENLRHARAANEGADEVAEEGYSDEEWGDAHDVVPESAALSAVSALSARPDASADWLTPTRWVAGSGHDEIADIEDDWLRRTPA